MKKDNRIVSKNYPSNSNKSKDAPQIKKIEKVTSGKVVKRKKSLGKKFTETFLGDDLNSVTGYILYDVLVPAAKNLIYEIVTGGTEMSLWGEVKGKRRGDRGKSQTSYSSYYRERDKDDRRERSLKNRTRHDFDDIVFESRGEAEEVRSRLVDFIDEYGIASVADYYDLAGITSNFTDNKYGWDNLADANIRRVRDGYIIELPKPIVLE